MGIVDEAKRFLETKKRFYRLVEQGNVSDLKEFISNQPLPLDRGFEVGGAIWDAIGADIENTTDVLAVLLPHITQEHFDYYTPHWLVLATQKNKPDVVTMVLAQCGSVDLSEAVKKAIQVKKSEILQLLVAHGARFDGDLAVDEWTHISGKGALVKKWLPHLTQLQRERALVLAATNKAPEVVAVLAPHCSQQACQKAVLAALRSDLNCLDCVDILQPFAGTTYIGGVYTKFERLYSLEPVVAVLPLVDIKRWSYIFARFVSTKEQAAILYPLVNPYVVRDLVKIQTRPYGRYREWDERLTHDERTATAERARQLSEMKTTAAPIVAFAQAAKDGDIAQLNILRASVDDDTVNAVFLMSVLWNNGSATHLFDDGIWEETLWMALRDAIEHNSPLLQWLITAFDFAHSPSKELYADTLARMLLKQRNFATYTQLVGVFSEINTKPILSMCVYANSIKAVDTILQNTPPPQWFVSTLLWNGKHRWIKHILKMHSAVDYFEAIEKNIKRIGSNSIAKTQRMIKSLQSICLHHAQLHPASAAIMLYRAVENHSNDLIAHLLPLVGETDRDHCFIAAAGNNNHFETFLSPRYSDQTYAWAMFNAAVRGRNDCVDKLWDYTDVDNVYQIFQHMGHINEKALYFYQRLEDQQLREQQRCLLMDVVVHETSVDHSAQRRM